MKKVILALLLVNLTSISIYCQITRGAIGNEIYFSSHLYDTGINSYYGVLRSLNNGKTISLQYYFTKPPYIMNLNSLCSGFESGILYAENDYANSVLKSSNFGLSWDSVFSSKYFASGNVSGEIICERTNLNSISSIWLSTDFGLNFDSLFICPTFTNIQVGTEAGEIYATKRDRYQHNLYYSNNYGEDFEIYPIDTNIAYWSSTPHISRGATKGELFLVSLNKENIWHFNIYYSSDYGKNFLLKYTSDSTCYFHKHCFTAGRLPGEFYMLLTLIDSLAFPIETEAYVYYSKDTAKTFDLFFHDLKQIPVTINKEIINKTQFRLFPNPASNRFSIVGSSNRNYNKKLQVFDLNGKLHFEGIIPFSQINMVIPTSDWENGIYLVRIMSFEGQCLGSGKVIVRH